MPNSLPPVHLTALTSPLLLTDILSAPSPLLPSPPSTYYSLLTHPSLPSHSHHPLSNHAPLSLLRAHCAFSSLAPPRACASHPTRLTPPSPAIATSSPPCPPLSPFPLLHAPRQHSSPASLSPYPLCPASLPHLAPTSLSPLSLSPHTSALLPPPLLAFPPPTLAPHCLHSLLSSHPSTPLLTTSSHSRALSTSHPRMLHLLYLLAPLHSTPSLHTHPSHSLAHTVPHLLSSPPPLLPPPIHSPTAPPPYCASLTAPLCLPSTTPIPSLPLTALPLSPPSINPPPPLTALVPLTLRLSASHSHHSLVDPCTASSPCTSLPLPHLPHTLHSLASSLPLPPLTTANSLPVPSSPAPAFARSSNLFPPHPVAP
ncbi:hypothetical protein APHAL10511_003450 [Amanita phalloides]|nr:hypothetical protein APHAL10511_003450 [Amanita phalloides]